MLRNSYNIFLQMDTFLLKNQVNFSIEGDQCSRKNIELDKTTNFILTKNYIVSKSIHHFNLILQLKLFRN